MTVAAAADTVTTRGRPLKLRASPHTEDVDVAELAMLPRLPDTRAELTAIAQALDVAPSTALHLGKDAQRSRPSKPPISRIIRSWPLRPMAWCRAISMASLSRRSR